MTQLTFGIYLREGRGTKDLQNQPHDLINVLTECMQLPPVSTDQKPTLEGPKDLAGPILIYHSTEANLDFKRN